MEVAWKTLLSLTLISSLALLEDWASKPTCRIIPNTESDVLEDDPEELKVMIVANLLLLGSEAGFVDLFFRHSYMTKFFRKSFRSLRPDLLLVLGDVSAKGSELTKSKWVSVLHQFHQMLDPFVGHPFHVVLGDRDIGECSSLDVKAVNWIASNFPGLDPSGSGAFEFGNLSFISLNAMALLCGNNDLRFGVEKIIERGSVELQMESEVASESMNEFNNIRDAYNKFGWRKSTVSSGSGPVLLLHFPLHRQEIHTSMEDNVIERIAYPLTERLRRLNSRGLAEAGPYKLSHTLPPNATAYIFQALKPRIIFSAHSQAFWHHVHLDGTCEISIPAMAWNARDDPGFIVATFYKSGRAIRVSYCSLARESRVLLVYILVLVLLFLVYSKI